MPNKPEHTGIRNGDLFCFHCGDSHKLITPIPVDKMVEVMTSFAKRHKKCPKTWEEPVIDDSITSIKYKMDWWLKNGEHGTSSEFMFQIISGKDLGVQGVPHPHDPDDFRRCYLLLKTIPEFKERLFKMKQVSEVWNCLVDNWDKLTEMLEKAIADNTDTAPEMYELMKSIGC